MSHITKQSQRDENAAIDACMNRNARPVWVTLEYDDGTTSQYQDGYEYTCGPNIKLSYAQDKCSICGKIFTY